MNKKKRQKLEKAGFKVGTVEEFLGTKQHKLLNKADPECSPCAPDCYCNTEQGVTPTYSIKNLLTRIEHLELTLALIRERYIEHHCADCSYMQGVATIALKHARKI